MPDRDMKQQIKHVIVKSLKLRREPESISDDVVLFGEGLNLDSIDVLTLVSALEDHFKIRIHDEEVSQLNTVNEIAAFIQKKTTQN